MGCIIGYEKTIDFARVRFAHRASEKKCSKIVKDKILRREIRKRREVEA